MLGLGRRPRSSARLCAAYGALGVGAALAEAAQAWAADWGVRQLVVGIEADNRPALRFYRPHRYRDNAVVWIKDLPKPSR